MAAQAVLKTFLFILPLFSAVRPKAQLAANFSASPVTGCAPIVVSFTDQSQGNPTQWKWYLDNTLFSILQNPSKTFFNAGSYSVKLIVINAAGNADSLVKTQYINVNGNPVIDFSGTPLIGCKPLPVQFTDLSLPGSGNINSWQWDFGDGSSFSALQNPNHTYTSAGNKNVTLKVTNNFGCTQVFTKPQYIQIHSGVTADFSNSNQSNCSFPVSINFQNLSTGTGSLGHQWKFGDGGFSNQANPAHSYLTAGNFMVTLITTDSNGCTDSIKKPVTIATGSIQASFTCADSICINKSITFTNTSTPTPTTAVWDFGDTSTSSLISPVKIYPAAGNYLVKMIANFGNCSDSISKNITVIGNPVSSFTASPLQHCNPPLTVNFTGACTGAVNYKWDFGDGSPADYSSNPVHTYLSYGSFKVVLICTNSLGCIDSIVKPAYINIKAPKVTIDDLPEEECAPLLHRFSATIASLDSTTGYLWNFGYGGFTSTLPNPVHTFTEGAYDISLTITTAGGCSATTSIPQGILASRKPVSKFVANPRETCAKVNVDFTDSSSGNVTKWFWDFGDGGTSTLKNPSHQFNDTGFFDIKLITWIHGCADTVIIKKYIHIYPPIANFTSPLNCINPFERVFTDKSIGADIWHWDFGDGDTSNLQNPTHIFADTGFYTIKLWVFNRISGCDNDHINTIHIINEKANFNSLDTVICRHTAASFFTTGINASSVATYNWTFGDGNAAWGASPSNIYDNNGKYDVKLIITDILGCQDSLIKPLYISVGSPVANFAPGAPGTCFQSPVVFTDSSLDDGTHPILKWIWNFGDGRKDTLTSPPFLHLYHQPGSFDVSLKVVDSRACADSVLKLSSIFISRPVAAFATPDSLSCPGKTIRFTSNSSGLSLHYTWDFGDNSPAATSANPTHTYQADGVYTIKLKITDLYGCTDSLVKQSYVIIASPHANFTMSDSISTCPPLVVNFANTSINSVSVNWDFGDSTSTNAANPSHFYTSPGIYHVKLSITGPGSCIDMITKTIVIRGPNGTFNYGPLIGCKPMQVNFTATTPDLLTFIWDFSDGTVITTPAKIISHSYINLGTYIPRLILIDSNGCQIPVNGPNPIKIVGANAKFNLNTTLLCDSGIVNFTDSSFGNDFISGYLWNFGDGNTSTLKNPVHNYASPGMYYPALKINTQAGCIDSFQLPSPIKIIAAPQAAFSTPPNACIPLNAGFNANLLVADTSLITWAWDFGNGNTSTLQNPPLQSYSAAGSYSIRLIAGNSSGCKDTVLKTIEAYPVPLVNAGSDTMICKGKGTTLTAKGAGSYIWSPANGLSCTNCASPYAAPGIQTRYTVIGRTQYGCSNSDTVEVKVVQPFLMTNSTGGTLCNGNSLRLYATGAASYFWSPEKGLSSSNVPAPMANPAISTTYRVIGSDKEGCFKDTGFVLVKVYPIPTVDAGLDKTINIGQSVELIPVISNDVTTAIWSPTASIIKTNFPSVTVQPGETTDYTLEVRNPGGCKAVDKVRVFVICDGANVYIPNTFSPNGDGINDRFYPRGTGLFSIRNLRIFSRWGEVVYEKSGFPANDEMAGWDGSFKGVKLTPDVYVYTMEVICKNSSIMVLKGNIALIK